MMLARVLGEYEPETHEEIAALLKPGAVFVDVGAAIGDFSLVASRLVAPSGKVLAIEPEPTNARWLRRTLEANDRENVDVIELALDDRDAKEAALHVSTNPGCHTLVDLPAEARDERREVSTARVRTRTLDGLLAELDIERVDLIKIDVEGCELRVLRGAQQTLASGERLTLLVEVHPHLGVAVSEVSDFLRERGFTVTTREARGGRRPATTAIVARR